jgi:hypothetical protein
MKWRENIASDMTSSQHRYGFQTKRRAMSKAGRAVLWEQRAGSVQSGRQEAWINNVPLVDYWTAANCMELAGDKNCKDLPLRWRELKFHCNTNFSDREKKISSFVVHVFQEQIGFELLINWRTETHIQYMRFTLSGSIEHGERRSALHYRQLLRHSHKARGLCFRRHCSHRPELEAVLAPPL